MKIKSNVSLILFLFILSVGHSQQFNFAKGFGSSSFLIDEKYDIKEQDGFIFSAGVFVGNSDFNPSSDTLYLNSTNGNVFISKFNTNGKLIWAKNIGNGGSLEMKDFAIDDSSNIYLSGNFKYTADFDPSSAVYNLTASVSSNQGNHDLFIAKYDSSGNFIWAKRMGNFDYETGEGIVLDDSSNIYITGTFSNLVDFDPDPNSSFYLNTPINDITSVFICKYDRNGNFIWAKMRNGPINETPQNFEIHYNKALNSIVLTYTFFGKQLLLYDNNGSIIWNNQIAAFNILYFHGIDSDQYGNIYFCGKYRNTIDFDPGPSVSNLTSISFGWDIFISKINPSGNFIFAKSMGGSSYDVAYSLTVDQQQNIYSTGWFHNSADFDPGPTNRTINSFNSRVAFISKLDSNGAYVWAKSFGGTNYTEGHGITLDRNDNIYTIGSFDGTVDFDPGNNNFNLTSIGSLDNTFIQRLGSITTSIEDQNNLSENYFFYPNPTITGEVIFEKEGSFKEVLVTVFNLNGQMISSDKYSFSDNLKIFLGNNNGVYFIEIKIPNHKTYHKKVVKI